MYKFLFCVSAKVYKKKLKEENNNNYASEEFVIIGLNQDEKSKVDIKPFVRLLALIKLFIFFVFKLMSSLYFLSHSFYANGIFFYISKLKK